MFEVIRINMETAKSEVILRFKEESLAKAKVWTFNNMCKRNDFDWFYLVKDTENAQGT